VISKPQQWGDLGLSMAVRPQEPKKGGEEGDMPWNIEKETKKSWKVPVRQPIPLTRIETVISTTVSALTLCSAAPYAKTTITNYVVTEDSTSLDIQDID